jgi:hypothetical protein
MIVFMMEIGANSSIVPMQEHRAAVKYEDKYEQAHEVKKFT